MAVYTTQLQWRSPYDTATLATNIYNHFIAAGWTCLASPHGQNYKVYTFNRQTNLIGDNLIVIVYSQYNRLVVRTCDAWAGYNQMYNSAPSLQNQSHPYLNAETFAVNLTTNDRPLYLPNSDCDLVITTDDMFTFIGATSGAIGGARVIGVAGFERNAGDTEGSGCYGTWASDQPHIVQVPSTLLKLNLAATNTSYGATTPLGGAEALSSVAEDGNDVLWSLTPYNSAYGKIKNQIFGVRIATKNKFTTGANTGTTLIDKYKWMFFNQDTNLCVAIPVQGGDPSPTPLPPTSYGDYSTFSFSNAGGAAVSSAQTKFGTKSLSLTGANNSYVTVKSQYSNNFVFGTGDFTIECWMYLNDTNNRNLIDFRPQNTQSGAYPTLYITGGPNPKLTYLTDYTQKINSSSNLSANTWYHVALCRASGTTKLYINGVLEGSFADSTNYLVGASRPAIGIDSNSLSSSSVFNGYIDSLKIYKGLAKYTSAFTPPTEELASLSKDSNIDKCLVFATFDTDLSYQGRLSTVTYTDPVASGSGGSGGSGGGSGSGSSIDYTAGVLFSPSVPNSGSGLQADAYSTVWTQTSTGVKIFGAGNTYGNEAWRMFDSDLSTFCIPNGYVNAVMVNNEYYRYAGFIHTSAKTVTTVELIAPSSGTLPATDIIIQGRMGNGSDDGRDGSWVTLADWSGISWENGSTTVFMNTVNSAFSAFRILCPFSQELRIAKANFYGY